MKSKCFIILLVATVALAQLNLPALECPVPGNPSVVTETDCALYTACEFTNGVCHMKNCSLASYVVSSDPQDTGRGFKVTLDKIDPLATMFGQDILQLTFEVIYHEENHVQIKIYDPNNDRYEVPFPLTFPPSGVVSNIYSVEVTSVGSPFKFNVTRTSTGTKVLKSVGPLTFEDQFIQFSQALPSDYLYGIGEHEHTQLRHIFNPRQTYPIFARDQGVIPENVNSYGTHPYFINVEDDEGNTHSQLFYSSNAMEFSTFTLIDGTPSITYRSIGGILDIHLFLGPDPDSVHTQYTAAVGKAVFPPLWAFGFQLSRWGYDSTDNYRMVRDRMKAAGIPQDVQYFDIDYMDGRRDFTYDPVNFADFSTLVQELHDDNVKVVLIFDPAIAAEWDSYPPATNGKASDVFVKWNSPDLVPADQLEGAQDYVVGNVWPSNKTVFPDFFNPNTKEWWSGELAKFHDQISFDGVWIDMNEPSNFGTNTAGAPLQCPDNNLDNPPYGTLAAFSSQSDTQRLSDRTICMSTTHTDLVKNFSHYDVHSLYGYTESLATKEAMNNIYPGYRPVILSRSTFVGSGKSTIHWLGDNTATWEQLAYSLIGIMEFNMFAIPMVGADVCGFNGEPSEELCIRWMQAGAFYPFDRNHNSIGTAAQDPARPGWNLCPGISRDVLLLRYKYIPYFYARFHRVHMNGQMAIRPLFHVFPSDLIARDISDQFLWSEDLMVAPVIQEGAVSRDVYFPDSLWYDLVTGDLVSSGGETLTVDAPLDKIPVFVRGGSILPFQEPGLTTFESRTNPYGITIALSATNTAFGEAFMDNGVTDHAMSETYLAKIDFDGTTLTFINSYDPTPAEGIMLETVQIYGFPATPISISVNDTEVPSSDYTYSSSKVLTLSISVPLNEDPFIFFEY